MRDLIEKQNRALLDVESTSFDLFRAALSLGRVGERVVDIKDCLLDIEDIALEIREALTENATFHERLHTLCEVLFVERSFAGSAEAYRSQESAFIDSVLESREGIPITLSLITIEVAKRIGIEAYGIDFPGHFLVGLEGENNKGVRELLILDPFHNGRLCSLSDLTAILRKLFQNRVTLAPKHLSRAQPKNVLVRMLNNMRAAAQSLRDFDTLDDVLSRLLWLRPNECEILASRAFTRRMLHDDSGAHEDALRALSAMADENGHDDIKEKLLRLLYAHNSVH